MLVLRRKIGESIILDGVISVSVLAVEGERVKIGITAPSEVRFVREVLLINAQGQVKLDTAAVIQCAGRPWSRKRSHGAQWRDFRCHSERNLSNQCQNEPQPLLMSF
jgi:carbon storage regulator